MHDTWSHIIFDAYVMALIAYLSMLEPNLDARPICPADAIYLYDQKNARVFLLKLHNL